MPYDLPAADRLRLRQLARRQAEIAALPIQQARRRLWTAVNDGATGTRPPFAIESWTFDRDFMPKDLFQCASDYGRRLEGGFLRHIRHHEILGDDHVCPDTLDMGWHVWQDEFGVEIRTQYIKDSEGVVTGYHFDCPVQDLAQGFAMIKPARFGVDRAGTQEEFAFLSDVFGDILPVAVRSGTYGNNNLTQRAMRILPQEALFMAMYDAPEQLHALMAHLADNARRMAQWAETEGLLELNNQNQCTCGTCFNFTDAFPRVRPPRGQVKLADMWAVMDSQETVGVKPQLFHEFFFPYYRDLAALYGQVYWGCCEPVDPIWERSIAHLPNLKAVSISRWAKQERMAEFLDGRGIVYSRKPNPNLLGVDRVLNEEAWAAELRSTIDLLKDRRVPYEFVVRDVYSMHGDLGKARRAVEIARRELDAVYGPLAAAAGAAA